MSPLINVTHGIKRPHESYTWLYLGALSLDNFLNARVSGRPQGYKYCDFSLRLPLSRAVTNHAQLSESDRSWGSELEASHEYSQRVTAIATLRLYEGHEDFKRVGRAAHLTQVDAFAVNEGRKKRTSSILTLRRLL